jgi:hypothetical protein
MAEKFSYKGFEIKVTRHTLWVRGVTTSWDRPKKKSKFEAWNPTTQQFFNGWGNKTKVKALIDSLEHQTQEA